MKCEVFTEDRLNRLLENRLSSNELRELKQHLMTEDCEACEQTFFGMRGEMNERLHRVFNALADSGNIPIETGQYSYQDNAKVLNSDTDDRDNKKANWTGSFFRRPYTTSLIGASVAAALLLVIGVIPQLQLDSRLGPQMSGKGSVETVDHINLTFAIGRHNQQGGFDVARGLLGKEYARDDKLMLYYKTSRPGYVYIVGYQPGSNRLNYLFPEQLIQNKQLASGEYTISDDNQIKRIPLDGIQGRYYVVGIISPELLHADEQLIELTKRAVSATTASEVTSSSQIGIVYDVIYFDVQS